MKVLLHWGARNTQATYRVEAADLESAAKVLNGREEWGHFAGRFSWKWTGDAKGNATSVRIEPTFTITMPSWPAYREQPQPCKDAWDEMWRALRRHEEGHKELFTDALSGLVDQLEALDAATGREIDDLMEKTESAIQSAQSEYDTKTDHGRSQGVVLTITDQCRTKRKGE